MNRLTRRLVLAFASLCVLVPAAVAAAAGEPSMDLPATATYGELEISSSLAVGIGLDCNLIGEELSCYSTEAEALEAAAGSGGVTAAATCSPPMTLWNGLSFTGSSLNIYTQSLWINLSAYSFDNITSSWATGCAGGYLANGTNGGGSRIGMPAYNSQANVGTFNNLASSAKRCPC